MKILQTSLSIIAITGFLLLSACNPSEEKKTFCNTDCIAETLKFESTDESGAYLYITPKECNVDSVLWGSKKAKRSISFEHIGDKEMKLNPSFIKVHFDDPKGVWFIYNDCRTGRGFFTKLPYDRSENISPNGKAINAVDPKYNISDNLIVTTDKGNLFIEERVSGKKAMMTFGKMTELDFNNLNAVLDSVNITSTKVWAKVKIGTEWKEIQKDIVLE